MEEKQKACRDILLSSPPGQFDYILNELLKINHSLEKDWIEQIRMEYLKKVEPKEGNTNPNELTTLLETHWNDKVNKNSNNNVNSNSNEPLMTIKNDHESPNQYHIQTSLENIQYTNCHCGSWVGTYIYDASTMILKGNVTLYVHYYENGNIHVSSEKTLEVNMKKDLELDRNALAKAIITQIDEWEKIFMMDLYEMYDTMSNDLKSMRRVLPISKVKMDWNMRTHRMAKTLNQTKKSFV